MDGGTIAALSTPSGRGGIAVIRVSGDLTRTIIKKIIEGVSEKIIDRKAVHSFIKDSDKRIEECVYTFFKSPNSYTGEDVVEISVHSNPFLSEAVLNLIFINGAREALPGEFTYRAFKNGKIDLIQAESVNELINANSRYYAEMKFGNLEGKLSAFLKDLKNEIVNLAVKIESIIEFQEDQSLERIEFTPELESSIAGLNRIISGFRFNEVLDKGLRVVIVGKANVGKSSLFNSLLLEDRSITSPIPGTTRDFIRERIFVEGYPVELTDVAGINSESADDIEKLGISRSLDLVKESDAVIFLLDGSSDIDENDRKIFKLIKGKKQVVFINKSDNMKDGIAETAASEFNIERISRLSVLKNIGLEKVYSFISSVINDIGEERAEISVNLRQKNLLAGIFHSLTNVKKMISAEKTNIELIAEEVRSCVTNIGKLMGEVASEDILGKIFSDFCIGK
ncbi:MAG: tRNA uridine-5-carboxymethylaminomethyl(34) synthesis GTPase MnmE [Candidatus Aminicenantes bacterium]|nr:tRNA uridine-5-carboxymethylaminomethyl(34) synthesis GTPase MnmE [Candidatus Aminicenantes bacterium]